MKHPLAKQMMELFEGNNSAYGVYKITGGIREDGKIRGKAETVREDVTEALWGLHLCGKTGLGIIPINEESECKFGAIDIDDYTLESTGADSKQKVLDMVREFNLPVVPVRSKSGGLHLYMFFSEWVAADQVQHKLREISSFLGYGTAEVFPKQTKILKERGDIGQWINMPYYNTNSSQRHALSPAGAALTISEFLVQARAKTLSPKQMSQFKCQIKIEDIADGPPCLQILSTQGFPAGTRNDGLFALGVYAQKAFPDEWEKKLEEYNIKYLKPPLGPREALSIIGSLKKKTYKYPCNKQPIMGCCNTKVCKTRKHGVGQSDFPTLGNLSRFESDPVIWFLDVEDKGRLELKTEELQSPFKFQRRCIEQLGIMPGVPSQAVWLVIVNELMQNVSVIPVPKEATPKGQLGVLLEEFIKTKPRSDEAPMILKGHIFDENEYHHFRLNDFVQFLGRKKFDWPLNKIASTLRDLGAESRGVHVGPGRFVNLYMIPFIVKNEETERKEPEETEDTI